MLEEVISVFSEVEGNCLFIPLKNRPFPSKSYIPGGVKPGVKWAEKGLSG